MLKHTRMATVAATAVASVALVGGMVAPAQASSEPLASTSEPAAEAAPANPSKAGKAVARERVHGPLYGKYKKRYPKALDWSNNGCSVPSGSGIPLQILKKYGDFWEKSCDRHDFGYRNHKKIKISRAAVDKRFRSNMKHQCDVDNAPGFPEPVAEAACRKAADGFYNAVRAFGHHWW